MSERRRDIIKRNLKKLTKKKILQLLENTLDRSYIFLKEKVSDYGVESFKNGGAILIITRMHDKFARMGNLLRSKEEPNFESIRDTIRDIHGYSTILLGLIDEDYADLEELKEQYRDIYGELEEEEEEEEET